MNPLQIIQSAAITLLVVAIGVYAWTCENAKRSLAIQTVLAEAKAEEYKKQSERNLKAKESVDVENKTLRGKLARSDKRLRDARASTSRVPPAPAGSKRPEIAAFDRAQLERAMAYLDERGSSIARQGAEATLDLDSAKEWASQIAVE